MLEKYGKDLERGVDVHWLSGVQLGVGLFNLIISLLPPRILSLAKFVGYSGNRRFGLALIEESAKIGGLRSTFASLSLLLYHTYIAPMGEFPDCDLEKAESHCQEKLGLYPTSILYLFFRARVHFVKTELKEAIRVHEEILRTPHDAMWEKLLHISWWELLWAHAGRREWDRGRCVCVCEGLRVIFFSHDFYSSYF
jgi:hypothetical protein